MTYLKYQLHFVGKISSGQLGCDSEIQGKGSGQNYAEGASLVKEMRFQA